MPTNEENDCNCLRRPPLRIAALWSSGSPMDDADADGVLLHPGDMAILDGEVDTLVERGRKVTLLLAAAISVALLSCAAIAFVSKAARAEQPALDRFSLDDHKAAINSFFVASEVLKDRCRAMTNVPAACLAKGEVAMLERVRKACEDAHGSKELCGEIADAKRY